MAYCKIGHLYNNKSMDSTLSTIITGIITIITIILKSKSDRKNNNMHFSRNSILLLINEDKVNVQYGKLPENKESILEEYDEYRANGGNSYIHDKVEDYLEWYANVEKDFKENKS